MLPEETTRPVPVTVWIFGGITVAATASFVLWGLAGNARRDTLRDECAPFCSASDASSVNRRYLAADLSLGVAVVSLGAASFFYFTRPSVPVRIGVGGGPRGLGLTLSGDL